MADNHYEILEIPSDADDREIRSAYHRLARQLHPDKASSADEAKALEERFARVSAAYNTLKDPAKRADYDKQVQTSGTRESSSTPPRKTATASVLTAGRGVPQAAPSTPRTGPAISPRSSLGLTPEKASIAQKAFARGMQFYKESNFLKAAEFFEAAIQNNDTEGIFHARLAAALIQAKKSATRAIDAAQRAIDLEPYNLDYKFNLAFVFEAIGSKSNAKKIYGEILRWDAGNTRALAALDALKKNKSMFAFGKGENGDKPGIIQQILGKFRK